MGHFGRRPIRLAWWSVVLPALMLNYLGQGAVLLAQGQAAVLNPFYSVVPSWALYPMVIVATVAATIASQALISGAFSLTQQAMQLGFVPRMRLMHTSRTEIGQIYLPGHQLGALAGDRGAGARVPDVGRPGRDVRRRRHRHDADHHDPLRGGRSIASGTGRSLAWSR